MRIPLIVSSRIQEGIEYPRVVLKAGRWKFEHDVVNSRLSVKAQDNSFELHEELVLESYTDVSLVCTSTGTEPHITVYACLSR
jgi:hypothetical protein